MAKNVSSTPGKPAKGSGDVREFISVGMNVMFDSRAADPRSPRFDATVIGWEVDKYILLKLAIKDGRSRTFDTRTLSALRFLKDGRACAARVHSQIERIEREHPILRVSWPTEVQFAATRQEDRIQVTLSGTGSIDGQFQAPAEILNVSQSGCRVYLPMALKAGDFISCEFTLPNGAKISSPKMCVRHAFPKGEGTVAGCTFEEIEESAVRAIAFFIATRYDRELTGESESLSVLILGKPNENIQSAVDELQQGGLSVCHAYSLVKAFTWLGTSSFDLFLIHCEMPDLDALQICGLAARSSVCDGMPIYIYGKSGEDYAAKVEEAGGKGLLPSIPAAEKMLELVTDAELVGV